MSENGKDKENSGKQKLLIAIPVVIFVALIGIAALLALQKKTEETTVQTTKNPQQTDTSQPATTPIALPAPLLDSLNMIVNASVGDYVSFGAYEQDDNLENGAEPVEWFVLEKREDATLLLSKYILDTKPYHEGDENATWETCTLREWLNDEFFRKAFSVEEQSYIAEASIENKKNEEYNVRGGKDTVDRVFLLSLSEAAAYFATNSSRCAGVTKYALFQSITYWDEGADLNPEECRAWWWLRSPGCDSNAAAGVTYEGGIDSTGYEENVIGNGVRPAVWVKY